MVTPEQHRLISARSRAISRAEVVLDRYSPDENIPVEGWHIERLSEALVDLTADLWHLADEYSLDFEAIVEQARTHVDAE